MEPPLLDTGYHHIMWPGLPAATTLRRTGLKLLKYPTNLNFVLVMFTYSG